MQETQWADLEELPPLPEEEFPPQRKKSEKKKTSSTSSSASAKRAGGTTAASPGWEKEIRQGVTEALIGTGAIAGLAMPVTGAVMVSRAPRTADALIRIARRDERVRNALLAMLRYSAYGELLMVVGALVIAISVDTERMAPDSAIAGILIGQEIKESGILERSQSTAAAGNGQQPAWVGGERSATGGSEGQLG
jgi:hypothetical protein